jgi:hypothetical protein
MRHDTRWLLRLTRTVGGVRLVAQQRRVGDPHAHGGGVTRSSVV